MTLLGNTRWCPVAEEPRSSTTHHHHHHHHQEEPRSSTTHHHHHHQEEPRSSWVIMFILLNACRLLTLCTLKQYFIDYLCIAQVAKIGGYLVSRRLVVGPKRRSLVPQALTGCSDQVACGRDSIHQRRRLCGRNGRCKHWVGQLLIHHRRQRVLAFIAGSPDGYDEYECTVYMSPSHVVVGRVKRTWSHLNKQCCCDVNTVVTFFFRVGRQYTKNNSLFMDLAEIILKSQALESSPCLDRMIRKYLILNTHRMLDICI